MNIYRTLLLVIVGALLAGCSSTSTGPAPIPTPASEPIAVMNADQLPANCSIVGVVTGPSIEVLQKKARKLGADAIVNPTGVDPVSGWATTQAIKFAK